MNLLTTPAQIKNKLILLIEECTSMQIAVAWGTANHDVYKVLIENQDKINKLVVGTHFFQTDPNFLEAFLDNDKIRVIYETGEVFHPKIYYFRLKDRWECLVGSANFTNGAMSKNKEILVSFSSDDKEVHQTEQEIWMIIKDWFNEGHIITNEYLLNYKKHYDSKKELLNNLSTSKTKDENSDFYKNDIFNYSWEEYFHKILNEDYHGSDSIHDRLKVLSSSRDLFKKDKFCNLSEEERRKISGYEEYKEDSEFDWQWFGSMKPEGTFKGLVKSNNENLSLALDQIPLEGSLTKEHYLSFLNYYKLAIPENSNRLSGATRLLAMKRPDYFFCLDSKNKKKFCQDFDIKEKDLHIDTYWDIVVDKITSCLWWSEKSKSGKSNKIEIDTWNGRAAFLDAVYYKKM
jgi:HKD family nuclease